MPLPSGSSLSTKHDSSSLGAADDTGMATPMLLASKSQGSASPKKNKEGDQVRWCVNQANDPSNDPVWQQVLAQTRQTTSTSDAAFPPAAGNGLYSDFQHSIGFNPHVLPNPDLNAEAPETFVPLEVGSTFAHHLDQPVAPSLLDGTVHMGSARPEYFAHGFPHPPLVHGASVQPFSWGYVGEGQVGLVRLVCRLNDS